MNYDDGYYDNEEVPPYVDPGPPNAGGGGVGDSNVGPYTGTSTGPGENFSNTGAQAGDDAARRDYIRGQFGELLARDYTDAEFEEAMRHYYGAGGDTAREYIVSLRGAGGDDGGGRRGGGGFGDFTPPDFDVPEWVAPSPFKFDAFQGPTAESFQTDPGYEFRNAQGQKAITNAAAAQGLSRSGNFLKDLASWSQGLASQEFGNVYNRRFNEWQGNRDLAEKNYERDWRQALTNYTLPYQREQDEFARALATYGANQDTYGMNSGNLLSLYGMATRSLPQYQPLSLPTNPIEVS